MIDLDDLSVYRRYDASGMLGHLHGFPQQCRQAWEKVMNFTLPPDYAEVDKVVVLGMGGSAIGGEMVRCLASAETGVPVWVHKDYGLPPFLDERTLVIASSYSGNTAETLSAFSESLSTPAKKLVITSNGELKHLADKHGIPTIPIDYQSSPRAAFPHSFVPQVGIFQNLKLFGDKTADFEETMQVLEALEASFGETVPIDSNPAKQLALRLLGRIVVIYGAEALAGVAQRWKAQINENSKTWAFYECLPDLTHNSVAGYEFPAWGEDRIRVLSLHSSLFHPGTQLRYEGTTKLLAKAGISHEPVEAIGKSRLAQLMGLVFLGDYASFYLAMLNGIDPTPVESIDYVKEFVAPSPLRVSG